MTPAFITALLDPAAYPHPVEVVRLIETHISWVLLAGDYAYKIKKPLDLGFLDFSSLQKRRYFCDEEVRLNRRLAPATYLGVAPITGTETAPRIDGDGPILDYAVRMRAFPAEASLDREPNLAPEQIDAIADATAAFHDRVECLPPDSPYGGPETVLQPALDNFAHLRRLISTPAILGQLDTLEAWTRAEGDRLGSQFAQRRAGGFIRDCHGDLHLGNIAWVDGAPLIFDCIEFNPGLRCIDVMSEIAFLFMDLASRHQAPLAWRLLNRYLEHTGDYAGLAVLRFYRVYRALVRAKVAAIRAGQTEAMPDAVRDHLDLAERLARPGRPALLLMHGLSGSGKTWLSQRVLERLGGIRLRSDVERKRLFGLAPPAASTSAVGAGIYSAEASARTFARLAELAAPLLDAGFIVIIDATFLRRDLREPFQQLALTHGATFRILSLQASNEILRARIRTRGLAGSDASEATLDVLQAQIAQQEPLTAEEQAQTRVFDLAQGPLWMDTIDTLLKGGPASRPV